MRPTACWRLGTFDTWRRRAARCRRAGGNRDQGALPPRPFRAHPQDISKQEDTGESSTALSRDCTLPLTCGPIRCKCCESTQCGAFVTEVSGRALWAAGAIHGQSAGSGCTGVAFRWRIPGISRILRGSWFAHRRRRANRRWGPRRSLRLTGLPMQARTALWIGTSTGGMSYEN